MAGTSKASDKPGPRDASPAPSGVPCSLSAMDSARFGVVVARSPHLTADGLAEADAFCRAHYVDLLIARCPTSDSAAIVNLEADGFRLMDTVVYWRRSLITSPLPPQDTTVKVRVLAPIDAEAASAVARQAFSAYDGHYHADTRLARAASTEAYASWAARCCAEAGAADAVLGVEVDRALAGFVALKRIDADTRDIMLAAVAPGAQGRGLFRALVASAMHMSAEHNFRAVEYSCVLTNISAQKALVRLGFEIDRSVHTFHKWFS